MKVSLSYLATICMIFFFAIFVSVSSGRNNTNFNETENAAKAIRKLLNGEIDSIKLENGDELKIETTDENYENYERNNNYSFISNYSEENDKKDLLRKKEQSKKIENSVIEDKEDFFILDSENIKNIAKFFVLENKFDESEIELFEQSLKNIIKSLNN
ncbi:conserved Plasmodium protein, unknown function [Plasmodium gallinaceum]|uniref:Uncharacterized protein n=1 Tax=Plasmodium gallinaceum TaxID=5849 RepID=A0A1J1GMA4_PLAGA|nr:conserved Plasmodium protein, unknown function [Plasmodium gallinaceum]CRG93373.1 conserved Plasmodium protein, unknown function [Plasmodium gallinaceum]